MEILTVEIYDNTTDHEYQSQDWDTYVQSEKVSVLVQFYFDETVFFIEYQPTNSSKLEATNSTSDYEYLHFSMEQKEFISLLERVKIQSEAEQKRNQYIAKKTNNSEIKITIAKEYINLHKKEIRDVVKNKTKKEWLEIYSELTSGLYGEVTIKEINEIEIINGETNEKEITIIETHWIVISGHDRDNGNPYLFEWDNPNE